MGQKSKCAVRARFFGLEAKNFGTMISSTSPACSSSRNHLCSDSLDVQKCQFLDFWGEIGTAANPD